ncbi:MAG: aspartate kinase [Candidatus Margulisiibacteriota bacterium]
MPIDVNSLIVQKFGGTSVGSPERIMAVADRVIQTLKKTRHVVVVVSAMGDTTDDLIDLAKKITATPDPREYDALISTGEAISAALLAMTLIQKGVPAVSLTGPQAGVETELAHVKAKITNVETTRLIQELEAGKVVVVTGFQGLNPNGDITTIGRGGSDTSAVVLAAALGAAECEIYTDVNGVYTTDPRLVPTAKKLQEIAYEEMLEMASLGAKVLHPRSVECAKENNIILQVRSSFAPDEGTKVKEVSVMEATKPVTGVTLNETEALVSILNVPDSPGVAGKVFTQLAEAAINVDMIIQSSEENHINKITFTVDQDDLAQARTVAETVAAELGAKGVKWDDAIAKVSIVGVGMISKPGVAAKLFSVLGQNGINIKLISTSEIKISCAIERKEAKRAVALLHAAFELDQ